MLKRVVVKILTAQAKRFIRKNKPKVVVVSGSVGKTSTTQAISTILSKQFTVRRTISNYNTDLGVPCSIFNRTFPRKLYNIFAWKWIILRNEITLIRKQNIDALVLELGSDSLGELAQYEWLNPDIAVVTAIASEHMEQFKTIENVAKEELSVSAFAEKTIINRDMIDPKYLEFANSDNIFNYSKDDIEHVGLTQDDLQVVGIHSIDAVCAGLAVGKDLGMSKSLLQSGAKAVVPQKGRMNVLKGIKNSTLIDDTYNSSPEAVIAALDHLYSVDAPQRIALLGNMNELGKESSAEHARIGDYCDPQKLNLVITLGEDSNNYIATQAKSRGCSVAVSMSATEAAEIIIRELKEEAIVLLKGSQNGVFAEETVKMLLADPDDKKHLVRQDKFWMKIKNKSLK